ncbi:MAG: biotin--[acetyl-CoA-carboxylase] ligase, partial [Clostridiaceae bacterium]|nr:biotin--[acetyl-CoA-carboxylase] ligase [Clostridiaceae bacterium]
MRQGQQGIEKETACGRKAQALHQALAPFWQDLAVQVYDTVSSTNDLAKAAARQGRSVLIASCQQTAGRGRRGRSFFSPAGSGLYFSLAFPWEREESPVLLTTMAAVASAQALEELLDLEIGIKWVNDLYYLKKKVAGILTEAVSRGKASYMVLGIGINLTPPPQGFPPDIAPRAGYLVHQARELDKGELICRISN